MGNQSAGKINSNYQSTDKGVLERTPTTPVTAEMPVDPNGRSLQTLRPVPGSTIVVASGEASAASSAVGTAGIYRISASKDCYLELGSDPTATTSKMVFLAGAEIWPLLATDKIAAIQMSEAGSVSITRIE